MQFKTVPSIQIASTTYQGSYGRLTEVNIAVAQWLKDNEYESDGPKFLYLPCQPRTDSESGGTGNLGVLSN